MRRVRKTEHERIDWPRQPVLCEVDSGEMGSVAERTLRNRTFKPVAAQINRMQFRRSWETNVPRQTIMREVQVVQLQEVLDAGCTVQHQQLESQGQSIACVVCA